MAAIRDVNAREVLDSRGNPTVEVDVILDDGCVGRATVPSGASTGTNEAIELRDNDPRRFHGKGVTKAVKAANGPLAEAIRGLDAESQVLIDTIMVSLDGTSNKANLGANAILGVSLAVAKAAAASKKVPLYRHVGGLFARVLPVPMMNIINGGAHADNPLDFQEFMIMPTGAATFFDAVRMGSEIFHTLRRSLSEAGHQTNVGDEGGFAPNLKSAEEALDLVMKAIEGSGYKPGDDVHIALDPAASEFFHEGAYHYAGESRVRAIDEHIRYLEGLVAKYPIISIEDPVAENDFSGWRGITAALGGKCQLVGDDVFCTRAELLREGIKQGLANSILVKVNQIGSLTEMLLTAETAHRAGYTVVMSHRSGETEDTTIADLAVAINCGQIKTGSLSRSDRTAKYNQLVRIEQSLGAEAVYGGRSALKVLRTT